MLTSFSYCSFSFMTDDEVLSLLDTMLDPNTLNDLQELVFRQAWVGKSYAEMADESSYDENYLKDVGSKLWKQLSQKLGTRVTKNNLHVSLRQLLGTATKPLSLASPSLPVPQCQIG
jgi:hypothetical protein